MDETESDETFEDPTFDDAAEGLRGLLAARNHPTVILWLRAGDLTRGAEGAGPVVSLEGAEEDGEARARSEFAAALARGFGVVLEAVCRLGDRVGVLVYGPKDAQEAERLLMGNLVKLGVPARLPEATARWAAC